MKGSYYSELRCECGFVMCDVRYANEPAVAAMVMAVGGSTGEHIVCINANCEHKGKVFKRPKVELEAL